MKSRINTKQEFRDLEKHIKENKSYNVTILEAKVRETGFTDRQIEQLGKILAEALAPIHKRLDRLEDFAVQQLVFNEEQRIINEEQKKYNKKIDKIEKLVELMAETPTMKKELEELKK